jgi:adenylosuccinate lyase
VLVEMPEVTRYLNRAEIERRLQPESYLGAAEQLVHDALAEHARDRRET